MCRAVGVDLQKVPCAARHALHGAAKSLRKRIVADRLQHVVQCIDGIALDGILRRICDKDNDNLGVDLADLLGSHHAIHKLHLDVHQDDVIDSLIAKCDLVAVGKFCHGKFFARHRAVFVNIFAQLAAVELVVFDKGQTNHTRHAPFCFYTKCSMFAGKLQGKPRISILIGFPQPSADTSYLRAHQ